MPDTMNALQALERLYEAQHGFAIVLDEYGALEGIVTRADALKAIRGDQSADSDDEPMLVRRDDGSYLVSAALSIDVLNEALSFRPPPNPPYHTVAGLVLHEMRRIPAAGDVIVVAGWRIEVMDMDGRRIDQVLMSRVPVRHGI